MGVVKKYKNRSEILKQSPKLNKVVFEFLQAVKEENSNKNRS